MTGWEPILAGHGEDRHVVYYRLRLPGGGWVAVSRKMNRWRWTHYLDSLEPPCASGTQPTLGGARNAAEEHLASHEPKRHV
jgi:hypothetical protein